MLKHLPKSLDPAPVDFFLFRKAKDELAGLFLSDILVLVAAGRGSEDRLTAREVAGHPLARLGKHVFQLLSGLSNATILLKSQNLSKNS